MKRILYVSAFVPSENARHAGGRVAYENLSRLRRSADAVDAIVCSTEAGVAEAARLADVQLIAQRPWDLVRYLVGEGRALGVQAVLTSPVIHTRLNLDAHRRLVGLLAAHTYEGVFVDFTQAVLLVERAMATADLDRPLRTTICLHDVWAQRMLRTPGFVSALLAGLVVRQEQRLVAAADAVLALSDKDSTLLCSLYAVQHVTVKPFVAPEWTANVRRSAATIEPRMLVFFGNFDRPDNSTAVVWFLEHVMTDIERAAPGVRLVLLGAGSDSLARRLGDERVSGVGFVDDPSPYFSRCALAIAPLLRGAGVKFKVLEALASGVPVVGTPIACEGVADQPLLTRAEPGEFAASTIRRLAALQPDVLVPARSREAIRGAGVSMTATVGPVAVPPRSLSQTPADQMHGSTLSVVSHGHGPLLDELLHDLAKQEGIAEHLVIVTLNLADEVFDESAHPSVRLLVVRNATPKGFAANHNAAFRRSVGSWFAVLNPDLRLPDRGTLRRLFTAPPVESRVALRAPVVLNSAGSPEDSVRTNLTPWSLLRRATGLDRRPHHPEGSTRRGEPFFWLAGMLLVIDREIYRQIGGFDERYFLYCEDCDLCARLYVAGFALEFDRTVRVIHDAQRDSHRSLKHLRWHLGSLAKYWTSKAFWKVVMLSLNPGRSV